MQFINPMVLWALLIGVIPVIIYYLMRYRSLRVVWGANYVLEQAIERLKKKLNLLQMLLLALRVLLCLALAFAFARPALLGRGLSGAGDEHHIIILDGSYSMLAGDNEETRWDIANSAIKELFDSWGRGQRWSMLFLGENGPEWVEQAGSFSSTRDALEKVERLSVQETAVSLLEAFDAIQDRYPAGDISIYVFSDDVDRTWRGMEEVSWPGDRGAPVYWLNSPLEDRTNLAVTSVTPAGARALTGHPHSFFVSVKNFGSQAAENVRVELLVDGIMSSRGEISVLPGQERTAHFEVTFDEPGPRSVTGRIEQDVLDFDNAMSAAVDVIDSLRVLVIRDPRRAGRFESSWDFLDVTARARNIAIRKSDAVFRIGPIVFTLCEQPCGPEELAEADVVVIDGGTRLSLELARNVEDYVRSGGGVLFLADELIDRERWNSVLDGFLPSGIGELHMERLGGERYQTLLSGDFESPPLRSFEYRELGNLGNAKIYTWHALEASEDEIEVLAHLSDLSPFLVRRDFSPGRVLLMAAGLNSRYNNLMVREFTVPLLSRIFSEAASGSIFPRTVRRFSRARMLIDNPEDVRAVTFAGEGISPIPLAMQDADHGRAIAELSTARIGTGLYNMTVLRREGRDMRVWFGVQGERVDSDLTPLDEERKTAIKAGTGMLEAGSWEDLYEFLQVEGLGAEIQHWVFALMLLFLVCEMAIERRFI